LTDYDNQRCLDIHSEHQKSSKQDAITYKNKEDETSTSSSISTIQKMTSSAMSNSVTSSNADVNQTLFKVRTRG
jgi:hypothetical protein